MRHSFFTLLQGVLDQVQEIDYDSAVLTYDAGGGAFSIWFSAISNLLLAAGGIIGLLASIKIYNNMQVGKGNVFYETKNLFLGAMFTTLLAAVIRTIFNL